MSDQQYTWTLLTYFGYVVPALYFFQHVILRKMKFSKMKVHYKAIFVFFLPMFLLGKLLKMYIDSLQNEWEEIS